MAAQAQPVFYKVFAWRIVSFVSGKLTEQAEQVWHLSTTFVNAMAELP